MSHYGIWPNAPLIWSENEVGNQEWDAYYDMYQYDNSDNRSPSDMSASMALWFAVGGAYHNYYMYYGGNNIGHYAGSSVSNMYQDGANLHFDALIHEPKHSHLSRFQRIIGEYNDILTYTPNNGPFKRPTPIILNNSTDLVEYGLFVEVCNKSAANQQWNLINVSSADITGEDKYALTDTQSAYVMQNAISSTDNPNIPLYLCINATGNGDLTMNECDTSEASQHWIFDSTTGTFESAKYSTCIATQANPLVKEGNCNVLSDPWNLPTWSMSVNSKTNVDLHDHGFKMKPSDIKLDSQLYMITSTGVSDNTIQSKCLSFEFYNGLFAYKYEKYDSSGKANGSLTFLINRISDNVTVNYEGNQYSLVTGAISMVDNTGTELFNTHTIVNLTYYSTAQRVYNTLVSFNQSDYSSWSEAQYIPLTSKNNGAIRPDSSIVGADGSPLEQLRTTNDTTEYFYYVRNITIPNDENGNPYGNVTLNFLGRVSNIFLIYLDDKYIGQIFNYDHTYGNVTFNLNFNLSKYTIAASKNQYKYGEDSYSNYVLTIMSGSTGTDNHVTTGTGPGYKYPDLQECKGLPWNLNLIINDINKTIDLFNGNENSGTSWYHWVGLTGQVLDVPSGSSSVSKLNWQTPAQCNESLTWYSTSFMVPNYDELMQMDNTTILLDIGSNGMSRGDYYLNGRHMGHYNNVSYDGVMVQQYYFIPKDYLNSGKETNSLIFAEQFPNVDVTQTRIVSSNIVYDS